MTTLTGFAPEKGFHFTAERFVDHVPQLDFHENMRLNTVGSVAEYDAKKDTIPAPPNPIERDILEKEAVHCAKLAADYAGENQKLRAEKNDTNERLKKLYGRLIVLETTIHELQDEVAALAWNK